MLLAVHPLHPEPRKIRRTVEILKDGGIVAYPTDTIYGLGCDLTQKLAIDKLYATKGMSRDHPLTFVCSSLSNIAQYAVVDDRAYRVMRRLLPGPYTFVLPATREVPRLLMMKRKTIGIRVPEHQIPLAIVRGLGNPIVSTSAASKDATFCHPEEINEHFRALDLVLDGGPGGLEPSSIIDLVGAEPLVLRRGSGPVDWFE